MLFFTQSRGTPAGVELESAIDRLLIKGDIAAFRGDMQSKQVADTSLQRYEGIYWDQDAETAYYAVTADNNELIVERPGRFRIVASSQPEEGRFVFAGGAIKIEFERDKVPAAAMHLTTPKRTERQVRHEPASQLPSAEELVARVGDAHDIDRLKDLGVVRLSGTMKMAAQGREARIRQWFDLRRTRTEIEMGATTTTIVTDGKDAAASAAGGPFKRLDGAAGKQALLSHPAIQFGGWQNGFAQLDVLKQVELDGEARWLIRATPADTPGATMILDATSGQIVGQQRLEFIPGAGFIGVEDTYADFRQVAGMTLPFRIVSKYAHPALGEVVVQYDSQQVGESASDLFELPPN